MLNEHSGVLLSDGQTSTTIAISTLPRLLMHSASHYRKPDAFRFKRDGRWIDLSTCEFLRRVEELFFALRAIGVQPKDRVALISENRPEWAIVDYAVLAAGAITVPMYPSLSTQQIEMLLLDCEPAAVFVSTWELLDKLLQAQKNVDVCYTVAFDPDIDVCGVTRLDTLYELGKPLADENPAEFCRAALSVDADDAATIIYTSGTTGVPKGAVLTHRNIVSNLTASSQRLPFRADDVNLSFLPLSHIFQRHVDYAAMLAGATTAYAESVLTVAEDMREVRPTLAAGVPRFFEKTYGRILSEVSRGSAVLRSVVGRALRAGKEYLRTSHSSLVFMVAERIVFEKIRARLGGRIRLFISGGAALAPEIGEFFWAIGLPIYEGYGLSETAPVVTLNGPGAVRLGTVGRVVGDQEVWIAEDGEILVRGSNVMQGYYRKEKETTEALQGGWFHTGDIGEIDADGFLRITDRKKDLIVTSTGKNVAPQPIENKLKLIPFFEHVVVTGDGRPCIAALIVPNSEVLEAYAREHDIQFEDPRELLQKPEIHALALAEIDRLTADLAPFEKIRKIAFLNNEFTIGGGELTPTLKICRSAIHKKYRSEIDQLYAS